MKYTFNEIKEKFENKSHIYRSDFIDEYDFDDDYKEYYKTFILRINGNIKNYNYLSDLIDLSAYLSFFDDEIYNKWVKYLFEKKHLVVKIAVLDYLMDSDTFYQDISLFNKLKIYLQSKIPMILRNQILLNLISFNDLNNETYILLLKKSILKTKDWRSIYRICRVINNNNRLNHLKISIFPMIKMLNEKYNFSSDIDKMIVSHS